MALKDGRAVQVQYDTAFLVNWPEHLGGGSVTIDFYGTMILQPFLATS
jgi:hypothetical protein